MLEANVELDDLRGSLAVAGWVWRRLRRRGRYDDRAHDCGATAASDRNSADGSDVFSNCERNGSSELPMAERSHQCEYRWRHFLQLYDFADNDG
jgi:hypothetical protein